MLVCQLLLSLSCIRDIISKPSVSPSPNKGHGKVSRRLVKDPPYTMYALYAAFLFWPSICFSLEIRKLIYWYSLLTI